MKKGIKIFIAVVLVLMALPGLIPGCSYRALEETESYSEPKPEKPQETAPVDMENESNGKLVYEQGESLESVSGAEYTVKKTYVVKDIYEAGLDEDDLYVNYYTEREHGEYVILMADMLVKNIDSGNYISIEYRLETKEEIESAMGLEEIFFCYQNPHGDEMKDYNDIKLEEGWGMYVTVGWLIPEETLEKDLYYVIQTGNEDQKVDRYIHLDI